MHKFDKAIQKALYRNIQVIDVGEYDGKTPEDSPWFTVNNRLFVLETGDTIEAIKQAVAKHIIGEDKELPAGELLDGTIEVGTEAHNYWMAKVMNENSLRKEQLSKLDLK